MLKLATDRCWVSNRGANGLAGWRMRALIMRLQQILAKTVGGIVPDAMYMVCPVLRVIVLDEERRAVHAIIMRLSRGVTTGPGEMESVDAGRGDFVQFCLRHIRARVTHVRFNQRHGLLALCGGHGAKRQTGALLQTRLATWAAEDIAQGLRGNHHGGFLRCRKALEQAKARRLFRP